MAQLSDTYPAFLAELKQRIRSARLRAAVTVNQDLIFLYWSIGRDILARQRSEGWGTKVIARLAADLRRAFPEMTGISGRNLRYMRTFAAAWPDEQFVQQAVAQLPWGHITYLLDGIKSPTEREWYARQAVDHGWSRSVLAHQVDGDLFARQGSALTNFTRTLPAAQSELAQQLIKDPYSFDFLALGTDMLERDLQRGLIEHLRLLILELGKGFAFIGSQYPIDVGGQNYFLDLLFYHLRLRCFVAIELKVEGFKPEFAGKMNFYLSAIDAQLRHTDDQPSIGIILCKGRNELVVEYALRDSSKPIGVAQYRLSPSLPERLKHELPTAEELDHEFPAMAVIALQAEAEYTLRDFAAAHEIPAQRPLTLASLLRELKQRGMTPPSTAPFLESLRVLSTKARSPNLEASAAAQAVAMGSQFIAELSGLD